MTVRNAMSSGVGVPGMSAVTSAGVTSGSAVGASTTGVSGGSAAARVLAASMAVGGGGLLVEAGVAEIGTAEERQRDVGLVSGGEEDDEGERRGLVAVVAEATTTATTTLMGAVGVSGYVDPQASSQVPMALPRFAKRAWVSTALLTIGVPPRARG